MVEIRLIRGPLDDERLAWIARLYGRHDGKYLSLEFVRHQFVENPFGWSLHVFAIERDRAVGHCGVIPVISRRGQEILLAGHVEGFFLEEEFRSVVTEEGRGRPLAVEMLSELYRFAQGQGVTMLHGMASEELGVLHRLAGCCAFQVHAPRYLLVTDPGAFGAGQSRLRSAGLAALALGQRVVEEAVYLVARVITTSWTGPAVSESVAEDRDLGGAPGAHGKWTIEAIDSWEWLAATGLLRVIRVAGRHGCRALVRWPCNGDTLQILAWRPAPPGGGLLASLLLVGAAVRLARQNRAACVRFQEWDAPASAGLVNACRIMGFVRRSGTMTLYVCSPSHDLDVDGIALTPFFYTTY